MGLKRKTTKSPPILSHEFVIQNHADIVSCVAMVFVCGLMFQTTAPIASMFMAVNHNITAPTTDPALPTLYTYGPKDFCVILFYFLICIVMHAIIQEYILDKLNRKMHLSKVKHSKFNESGQLLIFYLVSVLWGGDIVFREDFMIRLSKLWDGYPDHHMTFMFKFFFIIQICYWLHCYPELYFQKTKKEEMMQRVTYASLYLIFIAASYFLNFTRVALCLILMHYIVEFIFHFARLLYFAEKSQAAQLAFTIYNGGFVLVRLGSIILSVLTFWYGLKLNNADSIDLLTGNFNTQTMRINCLFSVCLVQAWMMWNFITFHLKRIREHSQTIKKKSNLKKDKKARLKEEEPSLVKCPKSRPTFISRKNVNNLRKPKSLKRNSEEDMNELPEVDQNTKKELRARSKGKK